MKINYRGCEIEAYRENRNSDLFYSVFDNGISKKSRTGNVLIKQQVYPIINLVYQHF